MTEPQEGPAAHDVLRVRAAVIDALSSSLDRGAAGLSAVPGLLRQVLEGETWRHFVTMRDEEVRHDDFRAFIRTPPLKGLGATEDLVRRIVSADIATLNLLDTVLQRRPGRPSTQVPEVWDEPSEAQPAAETLSNIQGSAPAGTSREAGLRKLRKHAPQYVPRVESGELSVHKALLDAGLRQRTV